MLQRITTVLILLLSTCSILAQFPDKVGMPGSTAISAENESLKEWATGCIVKRGLIDISQPHLGSAEFGSIQNTLGKSDNKVLSLGDGGEAVLTFAHPIIDGPGPDFAVYENSFDDYFLEFAFVEVSSDGNHFVRFPAISNSQHMQQIGPFDYIHDITALHNLAGKYRGGYGTPFDLSELSGIDGLNINAITHVKIIDVIGSVKSEYGSRDSRGTLINDPWPTPFETCGFDLDGIGVMNVENGIKQELVAIPNPIQGNQKGFTLKTSVMPSSITLYSMQGVELQTVHDGMMPTNDLPSGIYGIKAMIDGAIQTGTIVIIR